jgi:N-methylhydantoinase A
MTRRSALGVDVGGTFTDLVWWDGEVLRSAKTSSTPDQSEGVIGGATKLLAGAAVDRFLHGTTVATNALLERRGASVAFITTAGFEDTIEIARQDRPSLYDSFADRATPLVGRSHRLGVRRVDEADEWTEEELERLSDAVESLAPEAVAISLLYGYADPALEERIAGALPGSMSVSRSSVVAPEFREYERASTTIVNAFLTPETSAYLEHLHQAVGSAGLPSDVMVMRSSGGLIPLTRAAQVPAAILLSGPAGGVVATAALGRQLEIDRLVSFDMGGTSTDVCRIDGGLPEAAYERVIEGLPVRMPSVAIHTVGAGGGSVGWIDSGGALRVGPRSAGATPGPVAYGRGGTEPTVTDANVWLGRIGAEARLAGDLLLDQEAAGVALGALGRRLGLDATSTALGIIEIVEAHMERAIRRVSVEEGADPRGAALVAFGGAGGLHATALARRLEMRSVIVPPHAGVFSAFGLLLSPPRVDRSLSITITAGSPPDLLSTTLADLSDATSGDFESDVGAPPDDVRLVADARYVGQAHETSIRVDSDPDWEVLVADFHAAHHQRNGFSRPGDPIEIVTVRAAAVGRPALDLDDLSAYSPQSACSPTSRGVVDATGRVVATSVWWRPTLAPRTVIVGPAVIEEAEATTYVGTGETLRVHESGSLEVTW